ncbi:TonB C-terminal domain-containing protein [Prosthecochloris sp.]|nr:TonB C-terminal domain-containing protein [Prosthecochloris sp.]RDD30687.1 hypothetical protein CR161_08205 [Prosthecochloris sp. ZM]
MVPVMIKSDEQTRESRRLIIALFIALCVHIAVFVVSIYVQRMKPPEPRVVTVSLVSLPGPGSDAAQELPGGAPVVDEALVVDNPEPEVSESAEPELVVMPEKPVIPIEPVKQEKKVEPERKAEKLPEKPENQLNDALRALKDAVNEKQPTDLERTLARLKQKVDTQGPPSSLYNRQGGIGSGAGSGSYGAPLSPYELYLSRVVTIITKSWSFSGELIREQGVVESYVALTIMPDGSVADLVFDRHSISSYFDETVKKAIEKASPLPPVPADVSLSALRIGLIFTPSGIE